MYQFDQTKPEEISCFFIGNSHDFSDTLLTLARASRDGVTFSRLTSIEALFDLPLRRPDRVRSIILNQSMGGALKASLHMLRDRFPNATIALAYRQVAVALNTLSDWNAAQPDAGLAFLPMNRDVDRWLTLLQLLICGENYVPAELYVSPPLQMAHRPEPPPEPKPLIDSAVQKSLDIKDPALKGTKDGLTNREVEVLTCVAEGKQNKNIANQLGLSEHTVKLHIHHVISKLGVNNRTEAAVWFLDKSRSELGV